MAIGLGACGEKSEPQPGEPTATSPGSGEPAGRGEKAHGNGAGAQRSDEPPERAVERAVRAYIEALDARDGERVCALLAPGAEDELRLPRERGSCPASLEASIGYRDPRGLPQFRGVRLTGVAGIDLRGEEARATTNIVTTFADRAEPSIEDDIIYLEQTGGRWKIAQPSAALYRAIGAEPGARSIAPPG